MVALAALVAAVGGAHGADTAFPGRNGLIAFNSEGSIYLVGPNGSNLRSLTPTSSDDTSGGVSFSANGEWLAFSAFRGSDPDVHVINVDGTRRRQVTFSRGVDVDPTWSPRGDRIAFETNRNGNADIYSVDEVGRNPERLTTARENELDPSWSPLGDKIAYTVEAVAGGTRQIWVMNADGSNKQQLTNAPAVSQNPNWSPDGTRIVFDSDREERGNFDIYSMAADGSDVRQLTDHPALDALAAYSPDGKRIVFVSDRVEKDSRRLFTMPSDGGAARVVIRSGGPFHQMVPDWQPQRTGRAEATERPPGTPLPARGVSNRVDPLYDASDAWSVEMREGVTHKINLSSTRGCASIALFAPGTRSFRTGRRLAGRDCGGYFTFTPGPGGGGRHTLLVRAQPGTSTIVPYRLQAAPAGPDDQGPGIELANYERRSGRLTGRGIDVVDLYRFDVRARSDVRIDFKAPARFSLDLTTLDGGAVARTSAGRLRQTLKPGTYLVKVTAAARGGGAYSLALLVRVVTKTTLGADGNRALTVPLGSSVLLQTETTPVPQGGRVRLRLDYDDPLSGWVFRRAWDVAPGGSVSFTAPAVGRWRVRAAFFGTRGSSPSASRDVTIRVLSVP